MDHVQHLSLLMSYLVAKTLTDCNVPGRAKPSIHSLFDETASGLRDCIS